MDEKSFIVVLTKFTLNISQN